MINEAVASSMISQLKVIVTRILADDVMQQVMKGTINHLAKSIKINIEGDLFQDLASFIITAIKSHSNVLDDADFILRDNLFNYYISCEQFKEGAQVLSGLNLESTSKIYTPQEKADIYVKCAEACLEDDETVDAEVFVNKASIYMNDVIEDIGLQLRYRVTFARVLDSNRKFVEAAMKYYELSNTSNVNVNQDDLIDLLCKAVTCAVLGKAGPQRTRVLGLLYKDERIRSLEQLPKYTSHASILTKMYTQQLLRADELNSFEATLAPHQIALTSDGFTVPEKAVIEHNMVAAGKIYDDITFTQLGYILRLDANKAEKVAAKMIGEDRLKASIDQTQGVLLFQNDSESLSQWDDSINNLCNEVSNSIDYIHQQLNIKSN